MIIDKKEKHLWPAISGAADYLAHIKTDLKLPENIIFNPVSSVTKTVMNNYKNKYYRLDADIYVLEGHNAAYVTNFGIGAPAFAMIMELLTALGCKNFIITGFAGSLQKTLKPGDIVVCEKALRDEGISSSYAAPEHFSYPSESLTNKIKKVLEAGKTPYHYGSTWTTDALHRETAQEITAYQKAGIMTVEMEAAAAFAVAHHYKTNCAAIFAVSDQLANLKWEPAFGDKAVGEALRKILTVSLAALK